MDISFFQYKNSSFIDTFLNKYTKKFPYQNTISLIGDCIEPLENKLSSTVDVSMSVVFMNCQFDLSFLNDKKNVFDLNNLTLEKKSITFK